MDPSRSASSKIVAAVPFQLVPGDRFNIALGCAIYLALTGSSEVINNKFLRKNLQAYTSWNWVLIVSRILLKQEQWDPFLLSNSFGVCMAFRTAGARGLTEMMRQKMGLRGVKLTKVQFAMMDHWVHTVPVLLMSYLVVKSGRRPLMTNGIVGIMAQMFFAYSQAGTLNVAELYMPHPAKRAWLASLAGQLLGPVLITGIVDRKWKKAGIILFIILLPWLSSSLDPNVKKKYYNPLMAHLAKVKEDMQEKERRRSGKKAVSLGFSLLGPSKGSTPNSSDSSDSSSDSDTEVDAATATSRRVASVPQGLITRSIKQPGQRPISYMLSAFEAKIPTLCNLSPFSSGSKYVMLESQVKRHVEELVSSAGTPSDGSIPSIALDLSDRYIGTKGCKALCEALRRVEDNQVLIHSVNLAGNNIQSEGLIDLSNAIRSSPALRHVKELILDWNPLGEASGHCFESLLSSLSVAQDLSTLSMQECQIPPAGAQAIASTLLTHSRSLRHLNLSHNSLGSSGGEVLAVALEHSGCHTITSVQLTGNSIPSAIQQAIGKVLQRNERMSRGALNGRFPFEGACLATCQRSTMSSSFTTKNMALSLPAAISGVLADMSPSKRSNMRGDDGSPWRTRQSGGGDISPTSALANGCKCVSCVAQEQMIRAEESHHAEVSHLQEELEALRRAVSDRDKRVHEMGENHAEQLSRQVALTDKRLAEASTRYENDLEAAKCRTVEVQKEAVGWKTRYEELLQEVEQARKGLRTAETEKQNHQHAREQLDRELADKHQQLMEKTSELADTRRRLGDELAHLKAELSRDKQSLLDKEAAIEDGHRQIQALKVTVEELEASKKRRETEFENTLSAERSKRDVVRRELEQAKETFAAERLHLLTRTSEMESSLRAIESKLTLAEQRCDSKDKELKVAHDKINSMKEDMIVLEAKVKESLEKAESEQRKASRLEREKEVAEAKLSTMSTVLAETRRTSEALQHELEGCQQDNATTSARKQEEIRTLQMKLDTTKKALSETNKILHRMRDIHKQSAELMTGLPVTSP
ncbi:hypothetical protein FOL47_006591 [Perkinsus chesapeaki]|uniref:Uncharacterized protein n=1 Tax=Perkinsus chesapeaki TaxID=330153 RepID=A0A7J6MYD5_PERCH|nr:hypothetical protein FOL47_006591 [Perkinsus chesapeaki]